MQNQKEICSRTKYFGKERGGRGERVREGGGGGGGGGGKGRNVG